MEQIINITPLLFLFVIFLGLFIVWRIFKFTKRVIHIKGFADYVSVLEYHMNKSYELIHKDRILVYSLEATKVPDEEFAVITEDFVRLVLKFIGPALKSDLISFYGNEDTFIFNVVEYFNTRYEDDAIRKQSIDELSSKEDDTSTTEVFN